MDFNQQNQIEAYLSGQMTPEEVSKFESLLEVNPELQQQLAFQTEIIQGIGNYRKTELKARLEAINPTPAWTIAQLSPVGQFIGGGIIVGAIGIGAYTFVSSPSNGIVAGEIMEVNAPEPIVVELEIPEITPLTIASLPEENDGLIVEDSEQSQSSNKTEIVAKEKKEEVFDPAVAVPDLNDVEAETDFQPNDLPVPDEDVRAERTENPVDVELIASKTAKVKYQYYAGKLYLYGKFQDEPYQILEINSASGRKVYLYHKKMFYHIEPVDKPTALKKLEDTSLVKELSILRKSK